jgi:CelD/BcsL family acetyltransferase involved in cellulose biosynthesis
MDGDSKLARSLSEGPEPGPTAGSSSVKANPHYSVQVITKEKDLANLERDWNRLSEAAELPNVFATFGWFRAWNQLRSREQHRGLRRPNVLVLKKDGAVVGISPLIYRETSRFGLAVRKLEFVGREADYNDFVLGDDPSGRSDGIVDFLVQRQNQWDLIDLRDLRETGNTMALIESALSSAGLIYRILPEKERCPYLPIDAPWSVILSRRSPSSRHVFRNQESRLNRMSTEGLDMRIIENPRDEPGLLDKLIAVESQKTVHGKLSPPFIGVYPEVFQSLFDTLGPRGWFYIAFMELGERPIAYRLGFRCGKKLWGFLTAYDHAFSHLSPGTMLTPAVLDYGFSHGYDEYDFLRGEELYKMHWSTGFHQTYRLMIWNRRWVSRSRAFVYLDLKTRVYRLLGRAS